MDIVGDEIGNPTDAGGDDGLSRRHVLHHRQRAPLPVGGRDGHVERGQ